MAGDLHRSNDDYWRPGKRTYAKMYRVYRHRASALDDNDESEQVVTAASDANNLD